MESIKAFDKTKDLQVTATDISPDKRGLDVVPHNTIDNPLYTSSSQLTDLSTVDVKLLSEQLESTDTGLVVNSVIHGVTTGGGGGYVDVKVTPSGALVTDVTLSGATTYQLNNLEDADPLYVGLAEPGGKYLIKKFSETTGIMLYANVSNNPSVTTYVLAWTNRATLTYSKFHEITGV